MFRVYAVVIHSPSANRFFRRRFRSSHPEVFLGNGIPKICSNFTGEHPCRSAISVKLQSNYNEITKRYGCSPENLQHILRALFSKNTPGGLLQEKLPTQMFDKVINMYVNMRCVRNLVPFAQFKKREKHSWRSFTFSKL